MNIVVKLKNKIQIKNFILSILLCLGVFNIGSVLANSNCVVNPIELNGCSDPTGVMNRNLRLLFKPACDDHDICYYQLGRAKSDCEGDFIARLNKVCHENFGRRALGHADINFRYCDDVVAATRLVMADHFKPKEEYAKGQTNAWNYMAALYSSSLATPCDVETPGIASSQANIFNGTFEQQFNKLVTTYGFNLTQIQAYTAKRHYFQRGGGDPLRLTCVTAQKSSTYQGCYPPYLEKYMAPGTAICPEEVFLAELNDWQALPTTYQNCSDPSWHAIMYRDLENGTFVN